MSETTGRLTVLKWDSHHFQFPVARIEGAATLSDLAELLGQARIDGVKLVYWSGPPEADLPPEFVGRFAGALVDRKVTLTMPLGDEPVPTECTLRAWPRGSGAEPLVRLALMAGERSRFRVDPRFPQPLFELLYKEWIERSCSGDIADVVLVAPDADGGEPQGLVTVAIKATVGHIGLVAVDAQARGRGLGTALMAAAHSFMAARGCTTASVVTQGDNLAALRLYARMGYRPAERSNVYHFWPLVS